MIKVIKFSSIWCQPCRVLAPIFNEVKSEISGVQFVELDADSNKDIVAKYLVSSVPTIIIEKNGEVVSRFSGVKTKTDIINIINQYK